MMFIDISTYVGHWPYRNLTYNTLEGLDKLAQDNEITHMAVANLNGFFYKDANFADLTQEQTAQVVNKSRPAVANALRLLQLPETVAEMVAGGKLSAGHARTVLAFEGEEAQTAAATAAVEKGLSVRELEKMAKAAKANPRPPAAPKKQDSFYDEVALSLKEALGRQVKVNVGGKGGTLQIEFFDAEDLRYLANKLAEECVMGQSLRKSNDCVRSSFFTTNPLFSFTESIL